MITGRLSGFPARRYRKRLAATVLSIPAWIGVDGHALAQMEPAVNPLRIEDLVRSGEPEQAVAEATAALELLRAGSEPASPGLIGRILAELCEAHNSLGEYERAESACLEAVATLEPAAPGDASALWVLKEKALPALGNTYAYSEQVEKELDAHRRLLALTGPGEAERVTLLWTIGVLHQQKGRWQDAEAAFVEGLAAVAAVPLSEREPTYIAYGQLARLYRTQERFNEAENALKTGIEALRREFGENSKYLPLLEEPLGWTYYEQGRIEAAQQTATTIIDRYERTGRGDGLLTVTVRLLLARTLDAQAPGSTDAEPSLAAALAASEGHVGIGVLLHALAKRELARHYLVKGDPADAELMAATAVDALVEFYDDENADTARANFLLAQARHSLDRDADAVAPLRDALAAQQASLPAYHSETGETLALLRELYDALGQRENRRAAEELITAYKAERAKFEAAK